eukprot:203957-Prorocentrum_minimum.AAC.2
MSRITHDYSGIHIALKRTFAPRSRPVRGSCLRVQRVKRVEVTTIKPLFTRSTSGEFNSPPAIFALRQEWQRAKKQVVLVRTETSPEDVGGMWAAEGIVTARGGTPIPPASHRSNTLACLGKDTLAFLGDYYCDMGDYYCD